MWAIPNSKAASVLGRAGNQVPVTSSKRSDFIGLILTNEIPEDEASMMPFR